ncbi:NADH-quinone oxidoreductase subunit J [Planctomyces sp. SH-PL62]|uniref:NADH-quinone oxidoreductase subunit J family protein n=1 Tax=Planctomyces sp. SH-PL62 TaxID=1636152 RepID=UPI00078E7427|nr:NADH-quinone oxidoreductase subunit J [Planctomyces sp. SH-PL62]AMV39570.1 NADH-quinone oxidoreductase subunit J [Planctomyces sp. SH-PL62]
MTTGSLILATIGILLGATGTYLLLPHRRGEAKARTIYILGATFAGLGLLGFLALLSPPALSPLADLVAGSFFYVFAGGALGCGVMTVTSRNPVYSALWFAAVVVSVAGLFLLADAQFLAAGSVIVYAGAIIVTFLFVIMLAQTEGRAVYDRAARSPGRAVFTSFLLLWSLAYCLASIQGTPNGPPVAGDAPTPESRLVRGREIAAFYQLAETNEARKALERTLRPTSALHADGDLSKPKPNVAGLGEALYTDHLLTVELAGSILFAALIAAVLIANPKRADAAPGAPPNVEA